MTEPLDPQQLVQDFGRLNENARAAKTDFAGLEIQGASPDGTVRAEMRAGKLMDLRILPAALDLGASALAQQVLLAVQDCETRSATALQQHTDPMAQALTSMLERLR